MSYMESKAFSKSTNAASRSRLFESNPLTILLKSWVCSVHPLPGNSLLDLCIALHQVYLELYLTKFYCADLLLRSSMLSVIFDLGEVTPLW